MGVLLNFLRHEYADKYLLQKGEIVVIYVTEDTHGIYDCGKYLGTMKNTHLIMDDILLITGDFGIIWNVDLSYLL